MTLFVMRVIVPLLNKADVSALEGERMLFICSKNDLKQGMEKAIAGLKCTSSMTVPVEGKLDNILAALSYADEFVHDSEDVEIVDVEKQKSYRFNSWGDFKKHAKKGKTLGDIQKGTRGVSNG